MKSIDKNYWEFEDETAHYQHLIGSDYGLDPLSKKKAIQDDKTILAGQIVDQLRIKKNHIGLEIGSGCGYITHPISKSARQVYAADISSTYIELAKKHCADRDNISFQILKNGNLDFIENQSLDFIYSNNVFIHFDIYEIMEYLKESYRVLKNGGHLWFDIANLDRRNSLNSADFLNTLKTKRQDPLNKTCIQFNSASSVIKAARHFGFYFKYPLHSPRFVTQLLFIKSPGFFQKNWGLPTKYLFLFSYNLKRFKSLVSTEKHGDGL